MEACVRSMLDDIEAIDQEATELAQEAIATQDQNDRTIGSLAQGESRHIHL